MKGARLLQEVAAGGVAVVDLPAAEAGDEVLVHPGLFGEQGAQDGGAGHHQGPPGPPDVEGGDVAVADGLLPAGLFGEGPQGEEGFYQETGLRHSLSPFLATGGFGSMGRGWARMVRMFTDVTTTRIGLQIT
jgi:hypothetical protein